VTSTPSPKVILDASNLHVGGAVQVAASLIDEITEIYDSAEAPYEWLRDMQIEASTLVGESLTSGNRHPNLKIVDHRPLQKSTILPRRRAYDVAMHVFGPVYRYPLAKRNIVGYADVRSIYPAPIALPRQRTRTRLRWKARGIVSRRAIRRANVVVVETSAIRQRLIELNLVQPDAVAVVPNTVNGVFFTPETWAEAPSPPRSSKHELRLAYTTRPYPHKNLAILPTIARELEQHHTLRVRFIVTLTPAEWNQQPAEFRDCCINVGRLSVQQLPSLLQTIDGVIFPSLLEAFSATPLESLAMGVPLCASDRDFVRSICKEMPVYIEPTDATSIAQTISDSYQDHRRLQENFDRGPQFVSSLPGPRERAESILSLIQTQYAVVN